MNPLTLVKRIQKINSTEASLGVSEEGSWHAKYKDSAYVFAGGIPFDLTEGDLLAVFAQYGEVVDVNLVRDKATGKSRGFAFIAYEDQRSTILAVDNLNGAKLLDRIIRVDHVSNYKKKEQEDEEKEKQKREARGVCYAFQRGECNRGDACRFSHDEQRNANTGWGPSKDKSSRWGHDKYDDPPKNHKSFMKHSSENASQVNLSHGESEPNSTYIDGRSVRREANEKYRDGQQELWERSFKDCDRDKFGRDSKKWKADSNGKDARHLESGGKYSEKSKSGRVQEDDFDMRRHEKRPRHDKKSLSLYKKEDEEPHRTSHR